MRFRRFFAWSDCSLILRGLDRGALGLWVLVFCGNWGWSQELRETFDGPNPGWEILSDGNAARVTSHRRLVEPTRNDGVVEQVVLQADQDRAAIQLDWPITPCRVLDELTCSVWVRANRAGLILSLRVMILDTIHRETDSPITFLVSGETYATAGKWQKLGCRTLSKTIEDKLILQRAMNHAIPASPQLVVTGVVLSAKLARGETALQIDDLELSPAVPAKSDSVPITKSAGELPNPNVEFRLDRLTIADRPFFPRMARDNGESVEQLRELGVNVVWIDGPTNSARAVQLRKGGLWVTATPPLARGEQGEVLSSREAGLPPIGSEANAVLFWMLGTRLPATQLNSTTDWSRQVQAADRSRNRPIAADVLGEEKSFSRHLQMLGLSRHVLNSSLTFCDYRDWLIERKSLARPGVFTWTWIQADALSAPGLPMCVEPEQLRLQIYAAIAGGCRGIGFWSNSSLASSDEDSSPVQLVSGKLETSIATGTSKAGPVRPVNSTTSSAMKVVGATERSLILQQLNLELALMEPWLASAGSVQRIPVSLGHPRAKSSGSSLTQLFSGGKSAEKDSKSATPNPQTVRGERELSAAILRGDLGTLVLPMWLELRSQFCPAQLSANDVTIVVPPGGDEYASAWEITTTGIRSLPRTRVPAGIQVVLSKFDQTAMILLTSDRELIGELREKINSIQERSARITMELADAKLKRVREVDTRMKSLGYGLSDGQQLLFAARVYLDQARQSYSKRDYHSARTLAADSLQLQRILQRAHWDDAIRRAGSPLASPYTVSFQTLPAQEQFMQRWRPTRLSDQGTTNAIDGSFEDSAKMIASGWTIECPELGGLIAGAEIFPEGHTGKSSLRLASQAVETAEAPQTAVSPAVKVTTPAIPVEAGQLVSIRGWVKAVTPVQSIDGFVIQDSLSGKPGAWRYHDANGWQRFEVLREAAHTGEFTLSLQLFGIGDVQIDDLQIGTMSARIQAVATEQPTDKPAPKGRFDFLPGLPKRLPGLPFPEHR